MNVALQTVVDKAVADCVARAERMFNVTIGAVRTNYKIRGARTIARATKLGHQLHMIGFNPKFVEADINDILSDTVPHEVAHLVCYANPALGRGHDTGWRRVAAALGCRPRARAAANPAYTEVIAAAKAKRIKYQYKLESGEILTLGSGYHAKLQKGKTYVVNANKEVLTGAQFVGAVRG